MEQVGWQCEHKCGFKHTDRESVEVHEGVCEHNPANAESGKTGPGIKTKMKAGPWVRSRGRKVTSDWAVWWWGMCGVGGMGHTHMAQ